MKTKSTDWRNGTRRFMRQFIRPCDSRLSSDCIGCQADMDSIIRHVESIIESERAGLMEKINNMPVSSKKYGEEGYSSSDASFKNDVLALLDGINS